MTRHLMNKQTIHALTTALSRPGAGQDAAVQAVFAPDAVINIAHPINAVIGADGFITDFLTPLRAAFDTLHRRDDILMGGDYEGSDWITTHGNYVGTFNAPWLGLKPSGRLEYLRFGEFYRMEDGKIVEGYIYLDLPQLMIATNQWPITDSPGNKRGYTGLIPGPMTNDGILLHDTDAAESATSYQIVTDMLARLATADETWRPYWDEAMMWYGPAAFGSFTGLEDFASFQRPFEEAFSLWSGGSTGNGVTRHFTRFGDGAYTCSGGWPSLMCVRKDSFLDQPPSTDTLLMRVCDWWRRDGDKLVENWVQVDIPDVLLQMGVDLFPGQHDVPPGPRNADAGVSP